MEENFVGYLLKTLDPITQREVEEHLRDHPEAQRRLELLRRALEPLGEDRGLIELPPAGLRQATLARVAEYRCRNLPYAPSPPSSRSTIPMRSRWRLPDALVAAAILLIVVGMVPLLRLKILHQWNITACKENLHKYGVQLAVYADQNNGRLPQVQDKPGRNAAGIFNVILSEKNQLGDDLSIACPSKGRHAPSNLTVDQVVALYHESRSEYERQVGRIGGCYAYVLGYRDARGTLHGLHRPTDSDQVPVLADRPPFDQRNLEGARDRNSQNHGGQGQNVLFLGGHVIFCTTRTVGLERDDIFLNQQMELAPGINRRDAVLASSGVRISLPARVDD